MGSFIPSLDSICLDTTAPTFDFRRSGQTLLSDENTQYVAEKFLWLSPFVTSKLPDLTGRENGYNA